MNAIPVSVVILTKNEGRRIGETLDTLDGFDDIWVVDSQSSDDTVLQAREYGVQVVGFEWNKSYPKKKQWALDNVPMRYDWVLLLDADERMTASLKTEIRALFTSGSPKAHGYFVKGLYRVGTQILRFGQINKKLMLFNRHNFFFPDVKDISFVGGWEVEGHYQPIQRAERENVRISTLKAHLIHDAFDDMAALNKRHENYASWEALMSLHGHWPKDPVAWRQTLKTVFRALPLRGVVVFIYSYIIRCGICDGRAGLAFARQRALYYADIERYKTQYKLRNKIHKV